MKEYWGYHLILDCRACDVEKIKSKENVAAFAKEMVKRIKMKAFGEPIVEHFATHDPAAAGFSLVQLIETSAITGHFVDKDGSAYLDIFSCMTFDLDEAKKVVDEFFSPDSMKVTYLTRQA